MQAFGPCKLGEVAGTAGPPRPSSPIQFTQQDDGAASKSTRHLLNPDKYYNKYDWTRKETPSDFDSILNGQKFKGKRASQTFRTCLTFYLQQRALLKTFARKQLYQTVSGFHPVLL